MIPSSVPRFFASVAPLQATPTTTPTPELGPEGLVTFWPALVRAGWFLAGFLAVVVVGRLALQPAFARVVRRRNRNNPTLRSALVLYFQLGVVALGILVGAGVAGYAGFLSDSALVISALALAVGVAAQEVIGSLVSGMALVFDSEFNVGDYIEWEGGSGVVQSIALRVTRVETPAGELVTIPNTILTGGSIVRPYGRGDLRIVQTLGVDYGADLETAMDRIEAAAVRVESVRTDPAPEVFVDDFGDTAAAIRVQYWIADPDRRDAVAVRSRVALAIKRSLDAAGIEFSPPSEHELEGNLTVDRRSDSAG